MCYEVIKSRSKTQLYANIVVRNFWGLGSGLYCETPLAQPLHMIRRRLFKVDSITLRIILDTRYRLKVPRHMQPTHELVIEGDDVIDMV